MRLPPLYQVTQQLARPRIASVRQSVEVELDKLGCTSGGLRAYLSEHAIEVDGILVINRVKPHTGLMGSIQSGLTKGSVGRSWWAGGRRPVPQPGNH